jgi:hypothetical protein
MVREKRGRRTQPKPTPESIYDSPRIKKMLAEPFGAPIDLTREEALALLEHHFDNPPPYDPKEADRRHRELRKIRRESGALFVRTDD